MNESKQYEMNLIDRILDIRREDEEKAARIATINKLIRLLTGSK